MRAAKDSSKAAKASCRADGALSVSSSRTTRVSPGPIVSA
jgi:hypothetical protein